MESDVVSEPRILTNADLAVSIARLEGRMDGIHEDISRLERSLLTFIEGNGSRPGALERITILEQRTLATDVVSLSLVNRLGSLESRESAASRIPWKAVVGIIGGLVGLAISLAEVIAKLAH